MLDTMFYAAVEVLKFALVVGVFGTLAVVAFMFVLATTDRIVGSLRKVESPKALRRPSHVALAGWVIIIGTVIGAYVKL